MHTQTTYNNGTNRSTPTEDHQFRVMAKLATLETGEFLCFMIEMGVAELLCMAAIPENDANESQVTVKLRARGSDSGFEFTVPSVIKQNRVGGELLTFDLLFGFMKLVCIVNIPEEGRDSAPVYVKIKINEKRAPKWKRSDV
jgi:hypothetical protein